MKLRIVAMFLIVLIMSSGCVHSKKNQRIRVAFFPNVTHGQALIMKNRSTLESAMGENVTVDWKMFNAGPAVVESMFAGQIDIAFIGPVPAINAFIKSDGDIRVISGSANGGVGLLAAKDSGIVEVGDLDGKTVAIPQLGNTQHLCLLSLLQQNHLRPSSEGGSVHVVAVSNPDIRGLLDRGELDAALVPEPWASILQIQCDAISIPFEGKDAATTVIIVRKDFLNENPELVEQFLSEHREVTQNMIADGEAAKNDMNAQLELLTGSAIAPEVLDAAFSRIVFSDLIPTQSLSEYAELCLSLGLIKKLPGPEWTESV
ncbi:MAG: ABC transporter substrate-binding protein [Clostridiaceae bacterium]|nr:ABC transporter substrate-binding protein [Clostridiaceae bacterium]